MAESKLIGKNYITPDLIAKVTGKAKYAEDFRAEGMLFAKLLLSPMPHARVKRLDLAEALAMPGVKAILTADDLPERADSLTDAGVVIKANLLGERALTNEPLYRGEPVLAVAAVDELTAADAIEKIVIEFEALPFTVDPVQSLRPGAPNARAEGNVWVPASPPAPAPPGGRGGPPSLPQIQERKWSEEAFDDYEQGRLPKGKGELEWSYGDIEEGFKKATLVLDETFVTPTTHNQPLESRSAMAYWQNGKLYLHGSTQSTAQTVPAVARWVGIDPRNVVVVAEYCGGAFGSKVTGAISMAIPALLSKKANAPVMMRISQEEEHYIGRARTGLHGRLKVGFTDAGRITAIDMGVIGDNGPYDQQSDVSNSGRMVSLLYQPESMRFSGIAVVTNTPPRGPQSQPGGMQGVMLIEPIVAKAARKLGLDQVSIRRLNAPQEKAKFGPPNARGQQANVTSAFIKEALDRGADLFKWEQRKAESGKRTGTKVRGVGVAMSVFTGGSTGFDALFVIKPDGRLAIQSGIGNFGTGSAFDCQRVTAEVLDVPWEKVDVTWGNTSRNLPYTCVSGGSQTTHAMTRAAHAAACDGVRKLQEVASKTLGGKPEDYKVQGERVHGNGRTMTLAEVARRAIELGGPYDGHELPKDINNVTKAAAAALAGQGLVGVARDNYPRDGQTHSFVAGFAEVEVDVETGKYAVLDYLAVGDVGTVIHPNNLGGQLLGRSMLGIGHVIGQKTVYDQHYGVPLAVRYYQTRPPTILDAPQKMGWDAVNIPDPETPVGARGVGEPPVGAGACAVLNALSAAVGDDVFRRAPVTLDIILSALEAGHPVGELLKAHV